jgi:hypothetical protein
MGILFQLVASSAEFPRPPFPLGDPRWHERDRFGLPKWPPTLLNESEEKRREKIATIKGLAADLSEAISRNLGRNEARDLIRDFAKPSQKKGKQPNRKLNSLVLALSDYAICNALDKVPSIPQVAKQIYSEWGSALGLQSIPATEKRIRRARACRQQQIESVRQRFGKSLLG